MSGPYSALYPVSEEFAQRREDYDDKLGLLTAQVVLRCAYADRHNVVKEICGGRLPYPNGASGKVPLACQAAIVATQAKGVFSGDQTINSLEALITVTFSNQITDAFSESLEPTAQFSTLDHRWFRWGSGSGDPLREEEAPGLLVRGLNLVRHVYDVQGTFSTDLATLVGSTNQAAYTSAPLGGMVFDVDTLLYCAPVINRKVDSLNVTKYDIEKKFTYQPQGWNTFFRTKTGTYQQIYLAGGSTPYTPYPLADFSNILP
jgi:hypothetical protein